jgi:hypothetical protein
MKITIALISISIVFLSCQNEKKESLVNDDRNVEMIPKIEKDILTSGEFESFKKNKRVLFYSAFWAGMSKDQMVKNLNYLLDKKEFFIDSTCLFENIKSNENIIGYEDKYRLHLVKHNYIESTILDDGLFTSNNYGYNLFTFWMTPSMGKSYKVYANFRLLENPSNYIHELEEISLYIFNANKNDFQNIVSTYTEKYGPPTKVKNESSKEQDNFGNISETILEVNYKLKDILIDISLGNDPSILMPCDIDKNSNFIHIRYRDNYYNELMDKVYEKKLKHQKEMDNYHKKKNEKHLKDELDKQI